MIRSSACKGVFKWKMTRPLPGLSGCMYCFGNSLFASHGSRKLDALFCSSASLSKQQVTFSPSVFTKFSWSSRLKFHSWSPCLCFSNKGVSNECQGSDKEAWKKDAYSHLSETTSKLSHVDSKGQAQMVDVGAKEDTSRVAMATAMVYLGPAAYPLVKENKIHKGNVLTVAQLAGIMATKLTPSLIPLCHNINITHSEVSLELDDENYAVRITGSVTSLGKTGVEMESLTSVTVAALTVYDMCKAVSREIVISEIKLLRKSGGKSGDYVADPCI